MSLRPTVRPGAEGIRNLASRLWAIGALMELLELTITVREKDDVALPPFTTSWSPAGVVLKVSATVRGSRRRISVSVKPSLSAAVSCNSRYEGYSWSGAANEPLATPLKDL